MSRSRNASRAFSPSCIKNPNRFLSITSDKRSVRWLWRDSACFFVLLFAFFFMALPSRMHFRFSRKRFGTATSSLSVDQHATGHSLCFGLVVLRAYLERQAWTPGLRGVISNRPRRDDRPSTAGALP